MLESEFQSLTQGVYGRIQMKAELLEDKTERTLIYGYTCDRDTFHLYLDSTGIQLVVYDIDGLVLKSVHEKDGLLPEACVPDKRVYPAACDFEFCRYLASIGVSVPFTTWDAQSDGRNAKKLVELVTGYKKADFTFQFEGGLRFLELESESEDRKVREVIESQLTGALRSTLLRGRSDGANAAKWIGNIPESVQHYLNRHRAVYSNGEYTLPAGASEALISAATAVYSGRLALMQAP